MQFSADIFFQPTQKISECLSRYVAAFRNMYIAPVDIAMTVLKKGYVVQP